MPRARRRHPARGARAAALAASVTSTALLAAWIAHGDGAFDGAPSDATDDGVVSGGVAVPGVSPDIVTAAPGDVTVAGPEPGSDSLGEAASEVTAPPDGSPADAPAVDETQVAESTGQDSEATDGPGAADPAPADDGVLTAGATERYADGVYLGTAEPTEWGDVQVEVTVANGAIVDVTAVQMPSGRRSTQINDRAAPILEADAVAMQTADLDIVSGATYTSITYADSLQAALDTAALAAAAAGVAAA